jgi:hypothetical protein
MPGQKAVSFGHREHPLVTAVAGATGAARVQSDQVDDGHQWKIYRLGVLSNSATPGQARVFKGDPIPQNYIAGTSTGSCDVAEGWAYVLPAGACITVVWANQTPGALCQMQLFYEDEFLVAVPIDPTMTSYS